MKPAPLNRFVIVGLVAIAIGAGVAAPRVPVLGAILLGLLLAVGVLRWRSLAVLRSTIDPGLRCDLERLASLATDGDVLGRHVAVVVLIHHGGFDRPMTELAEDDHPLAAELDDARHIVRKSWGRLGVPAHDDAVKQAAVDDVSPLHRDAVASIRLLGYVISYAAMVEEQGAPSSGRELFAGSLDHCMQTWPALKWPLHLAAAREALARGDAASCSGYLEGMPGWPESSPLERVRQRLLARVEGASDVG